MSFDISSVNNAINQGLTDITKIETAVRSFGSPGSTGTVVNSAGIGSLGFQTTTQYSTAEIAGIALLVLVGLVIVFVVIG